tara:strand:- start:227 stop:448 length:222 start_codon:yes stop_codon:yes gene_type:complete
MAKPVYWFVVQSYIGSKADQFLGKMYVQQARGDDTFKYHRHTKRPRDLMSSKDIEIRTKANDDLKIIFYPDFT